MADCKPLAILERPQVAYSRSESSRNSSSESLSLSVTLGTRKLAALPVSLRAPTSSDQVRTRCKELIMDYKELEGQLAKFSHRSSQLSKTNSLRLTLLRFLRLQSDSFMGHYDREMHSFVVRTASYGVKVFSQWWATLLEDLTTSPSSSSSSRLSNVDRSAYLECISRIMARKEWHFTKRDSSVYSDQLTLTLEYCFNKLIPMKNSTLSISAFVGKVFAYCFMNVHHFARLLLFTLFVKNYTLTKFIHIIPEKLAQDHSLRSAAEHLFHPSLLEFIDYRGDFGPILHKGEELTPKFWGAACMTPPRVATFGNLEINLKDSAWVKKWASFGSDIFGAFLKHYLNFCLDNFHPATHQDLFHCPGFAIIYAHIVEIFDSSVQHIKKFRATQFKEQSGYNDVMVMTQSGARQDVQKFIRKLPIMTIFSVVRSIIYESDEHHGMVLVKSVESIMSAKASKIHAYDFQTCEAIYDLFSELLIHLQHDSQKFSRQLDWNFWVTGLIRMIQTGHMICQVKSLCFMFNIWNMLPIDFAVDIQRDELIWIVKKDLTLIYNLSAYMISKEVWENLFGHWSPLIRHYYIRLVIFKIIGTSNDNYGSYLAFKKTVKERLQSTYDLFRRETTDSEWTMIKQLEILPANPIVNKKLIITPMDQSATSATSTSVVNILDSFSLSVPYQSLSGSNSTTSSTSTLLLPSNRKIYAYDIFDDAIYSSSIGFASSTSIPKNSSRTSIGSVSPSLSGSSITRSSSGSSLGRVPVLGTALSSFFKKFNGSQPNLQSASTLQSPMASPTIHEGTTADGISMLRASPYLNSNPSSVSSFNSRSPIVMKVSPSLLSSPTSSLSEISDEDQDLFLSIPKTRQPSKSPASVTSRVSSISSSTSAASMNSMDALPTPPELIRKVPEMKKFKYKFHLVFSNDSLQMQSRITKNKKLKFFKECETVTMPKRPILPFEKSNIGLLSSESFSNLDEDDEDGDDFGEFLILPRKSTQSYTESIKGTVEFKHLKNHLLLGRFLNEWQVAVEEYEKFMSFTNEFVSSDESTFIDPMLVADIPPFKVK